MNNIRRLGSSLILCGCLMLSVSSVGWTQDIIGVVDMQTVLSESIAGKAAKHDLESEIKKSQSEIEKFKLELRQMQENLQRQSKILSQSALSDKAAVLAKKERELRRKIGDQQANYLRRNNILIENIAVEVKKILAELAAKEGYLYVLERGQNLVIYADQRLDLTDKVVAILDKKKLEL